MATVVFSLLYSLRLLGSVTRYAAPGDSRTSAPTDGHQAIPPSTALPDDGRPHIVGMASQIWIGWRSMFHMVQPRRVRQFRRPSFHLRGTVVVVQQAADPFASANRTVSISSREWLNQPVVDPLMVSFAMGRSHPVARVRAPRPRDATKSLRESRHRLVAPRVDLSVRPLEEMLKRDSVRHRC
jgi:hypothetical protein